MEESSPAPGGSEPAMVEGRRDDGGEVPSGAAFRTRTVRW
jgi:hypothetical protein